MKKLFQIILTGLSTLAVILLLGLAYVRFFLPKTEAAPDLKIASNEEVLKRGEYLANHVVACVDCHSSRDWSKYSGPVIPGTEGKGGELFDSKMGFPGTFHSKNITPAGIGHWTDGELYRVITTGVTKNGDALFPVMPYKAYGQMAPDDVKAIIAYIRSLKPIENEVPVSEADFPVNILLRTIPESVQGTPTRPAQTDLLAYGKYLTTIAACSECHTPRPDGKPNMELQLAGGAEFQMPGGIIIRSANLTPDKETGIGNWTEEAFVNRFKAYNNTEAHNLPVASGTANTPMPWTIYAGMTETDLKAIFTYLQSMPAKKNQVQRISKAVAMN